MTMNPQILLSRAGARFFSFAALVRGLSACSRPSAHALWCVLVAACVQFAASPALAGFSVQNGNLIDNNGNVFILRGIAHPHVWFPTQTATAIPNIAATGANAVRLVLGNGRQWGPNSQADVANLITLCKNNKLIAIPEVHDCTGFGDTGGFAPNAAPLSTAVDYWISIQGALTGQENYVIINIANEPFGNGVSASTWVNEHIAAIQRLRNAGFTHTLMIDAANWGQDWENIMRNNATQVFNADPLRNIVFSVHMYEVYQQDSVIESYMNAFDTANLPLVIGEFAATHGSSDVNEASIMQRAQQHGFGYIGWSWSGNGGGLGALDVVVNFNPAQRTSWGNTLIGGANGIAATSQIASVYNTTTPTLTVTPATLSFSSAAGSSAVTVTSNTNWSVTDNQAWISVTPTSGTNNGSVSVSVTQNTGTASRSGTVTFTGGGITRTVSVTQAPSTGNTLTVAPTSLSFSAPAGSSTVSVTSNVSWTVTDNQTWISASPTTGANNASVIVSVTQNTGTTSRSGTVTIAGGGITRTIAVTQAAPSANTLTVSPTSLTLGAAAGSGTFGITSNVSWTVTDNQTWLTVSPTSGSNNATITVTATQNTATTARTGTVTVTGGGLTRTVAVSQNAAGTTPCSNPTTITLPFTRDGAGSFCWFTTGNIANVNSWNLQTLEINGVTFTNQWVGTSNLPPRINGGYYIRYVGNVAWAHVEINGTN